MFVDEPGDESPLLSFPDLTRRPTSILPKRRASERQEQNPCLAGKQRGIFVPAVLYGDSALITHKHPQKEENQGKPKQQQKKNIPGTSVVVLIIFLLYPPLPPRSSWSVNIQRATPCRHCRDARVYGHTTTPMQYTWYE